MKRTTRWARLTALAIILSMLALSFGPAASAGQERGQAANKQETNKQTPRTTGGKKAVKVKPTPDLNADPDAAEENDPDRPRQVKGLVNNAEYLRRRQEYINMKLGMELDRPYDPNIREQAVRQMSAQEAQLSADVRKGRLSPRVLSTGWTNIGPFPIPDGQTSGVVQAVSGRTVAIAVHPTNADIVYVGAAQGGVYRSLNGGQTWKQLFDAADSQVIGALALAPSNPDILFVGTGEAGQCGSGCYAGIGVYRIDNASTTADLTGPINPLRNYNDAMNNPVSGNVFTGRAISKILVNPTDPSIIFVGIASGIVGNPQQAPQNNTVPPLGVRGLYRLANATGPATGVTATKLTVAATNCFDTPCTGSQSVLDMVYDGNDATGNTLVLWLRPTTGTEGGVYRTTNALSTATFTNTLVQTSTTNSRGELASVTIAGTTTMYLANGESSTGRLRKSVDGGQTWSAILAGAAGFCSTQCFYDIAIAIDPTNANIAYVGGAAGSNILRKTTDGFATTANTPSRQSGLHADNHVIVVAPSNRNIVYDGSDGGIWRSDDAGTTWRSLNSRTYVATQFQSVANHPTERYFVIGGTQDNGTEWLQPNQFSQLPFDGWTHGDFGDGGYARIDQTASDNTNVVMYHTYFNQTNSLLGFARVSNTLCAYDGDWAFKGFGAGTFTNECGDVEAQNGIAGTDAVLFYAPLELGPPVAGSQGQTVYFGTDRLYRSINKGDTMTVVSSAPSAAIVAGQPITTIAIAPSDDNYRFVGLTNGNVWGSTTGLPPFVNVTPPATVAKGVGKIVIDPNDKNTAFVGYGGQYASAAPAAQHIWKTTNLNAVTPTWTAVGNGIPDVPVNALAVDPANSMIVFAGTDVGVYRSTDGGNNWSPYNTGMPKIAIFDLQIQNANRLLRAATHGRGIWEIGLDPGVVISGQIVNSSNVGQSGVTVRLTGSAPAPLTVVTDANGNYSFGALNVPGGLVVGGNYTVMPVANGTRSFIPASRTYPDIPASRTGQNYVTTTPPAPITSGPQAASPGQVLISEFRLRGAAGAADEFVELYNNTDAAITVSTADGSEGWALDASQADGATRFTAATVPVGTVIPARGHYLFAAQNYSLNSRAAADFYYTPSLSQADIADNTGLALYSTANRANFAPANRLDAVGFTGAPAPDREGTGLTPIATSDADYSYVRGIIGATSGNLRDSDNNTADFTLVSPTGVVGATTAQLGAPGPENLNAPIQRNATIRASLVDTTVSSVVSPNRVRDTTETGVNKNLGTLTIRRRFTNNTGVAVTRLRFRIVDITTLNSGGAGPSQADLRALDSSAVIAGTLNIKGTTLELPPEQLLGGGVNSSLNVVLPDPNGLAPLVSGVCVTGQCTIDVQFKLGVVQGGAFRFFVNVEALP